ncbi:MAG: 4-hydroxy-tetrahydrodipicolinate synthase [Candidatus Diapherotrites archaeon]|uniref:4-hydroxy-tetrahydrodipicolinate synthase n=1 Tax=Candidatus Iainarchaeum sp. TaxID=3101447 RepID=A0A939C4T7_9ARCH|nr:4-hydroxy-tetrahydrodipicolinate synthase [Candidatus Diapherotrites archaeon]
MSKKISGCFPALVTPMKQDGNRLNHAIDFEGLKQLIDYVANGRVTGIVAGGCTGHAASLTHDEQVRLVEKAMEAAGSTEVIAGDGSNCTREAIDLAREMQDLGIKRHLQISPYQNKPTQEGLYQHYAAIAKAIDTEIIVYNVPGRTGRNVEPETVLRLATEFSNVVAVKEASGNLEQIKKVIEVARDLEFDVISGDDSLTLEIIKAGGTGCISVAANVAPKQTTEMISLALQGKIEQAKRIDESLGELYRVLFIETNPGPAHYALRKLGIKAGIPRLPLVDVTRESAKQIDSALKGLGLVK